MEEAKKIQTLQSTKIGTASFSAVHVENCWRPTEEFFWVEQFDAEIENGGIVTYGVRVTTLDEVFLLVAHGGDANHDTKDYASSGQVNGVAMTYDAEKSVRP